MAFYIPPEYYGLNSLGQAAGAIGGQIKEFKQDKRDQEDREMAEVLRQYEIVKNLGGVEEANKFLQSVKGGKYAEMAVENVLVPEGEQRAKAIAGQTGEQRNESLGLSTRTPEQIREENALKNEHLVLSAVTSELELLKKAIDANPSNADAIIAQASERLKSQLGPIGVDLTPDQLRTIHTKNLKPGSPEWNTVIWSHPKGPKGLGDRELQTDRAGEAKIENLQSDTERNRAQAGYYKAQAAETRNSSKGKTFDQIAKEQRLKLLIEKGVPNDVALKAISGLALTPQEQAQVERATAQMSGGTDFWTRLQKGDLPTTFATEEEARAFAAEAQRVHGVKATPVQQKAGVMDFGKPDGEWKLRFDGDDAVDPAVARVEATQQINVDAGKMGQLVGVLMTMSNGEVDRPTAETMANNAIAQFGSVDAALEQARKVAQESGAAEAPTQKPTASSPSENRTKVDRFADTPEEIKTALAKVEQELEKLGPAKRNEPGSVAVKRRRLESRKEHLERAAQRVSRER